MHRWPASRPGVGLHGSGSRGPLTTWRMASLGQQRAPERWEELASVLWVLDFSNSQRGLVKLKSVRDAVESTRWRFLAQPLVWLSSGVLWL